MFRVPGFFVVGFRGCGIGFRLFRRHKVAVAAAQHLLMKLRSRAHCHVAPTAVPRKMTAVKVVITTTRTVGNGCTVPVNSIMSITTKSLQMLQVCPVTQAGRRGCSQKSSYVWSPAFLKTSVLKHRQSSARTMCMSGRRFLVFTSSPAGTWHATEDKATAKGWSSQGSRGSVLL